MADPTASGPTLRCPACDTLLPPDATFCLQCGHRMAIRPGGTPGPKAVRPVAATMIGAAGSAFMDRTIPDAPPIASEPTMAPDRPVEGTRVQQPLRVPNAQRTMMGVASEDLLADPNFRKTAGGAPARGGTMIGGAIAPAPTPAAGFSPAGRTTPGAGAPLPADPIAPVDRNAMPAAYPAGHPPPAGSSQQPRRERAPMMGGPAPGVPAATRPPGMPGESWGHVPADSQGFDVPGLPRRRSLAWLPALGLLLGAGLLGVTALWFHAQTHDAPAAALPAWLEETPAGTLLAVDVPDAANGTRLRYRGVDYPVPPGGAVSFPAGTLPSEVGVVSVPIEILRPSAPPERRSAEVMIAWRVEPDLQHLGDDPPLIHLDFHVPIGSSLSVSGHPIALAGAMGIAEIHAPDPLPLDAANPVWSSRFPIRVVASNGSVSVGEYELRVPRATIRIDSPGPAAVVNTDTVTLRGRAPGATRISVSGIIVRPADGVFSADVHPTRGLTTVPVIAWTPGAVPVRATVNLYRDVTPQSYLGANAQGPSAIATSTPTEGVKVRLDGRVLGLPVAGPDGPTFQLLVDDRACTAGHCLVWINPSGAASVRDGDRVEVVGETHGVRSYTTQGGERRTDPVVVGLFVLPLRR